MGYNPESRVLLFHCHVGPTKTFVLFVSLRKHALHFVKGKSARYQVDKPMTPALLLIEYPRYDVCKEVTICY